LQDIPVSYTIPLAIIQAIYICQEERRILSYYFVASLSLADGKTHLSNSLHAL